MKIEATASSEAKVVAKGSLSASQLVLFGVIALAATILTRFALLPLSVLDWDESVYLLVSQDLLDGVFPYSGAFDHKPVGLYYLFAIFQVLFGESVQAIRLLAIAAVAATALLIAVFLRKHANAGVGASAVAVTVYVFLSLPNQGLATNTEIIINFYFVAMLVLANSAAFTTRFAPTSAVALGIVLGLMVQTNYLSALLVIGFAIAYLLVLALGHSWQKAAGLYLRNGILVFLSFLATFAALLLPIVLWGDIDSYFYMQFAFLSGYRFQGTFFYFSTQLAKGLLPYGAFLALAVTLVAFIAWKSFRRPGELRRERLVAVQMLIYLGIALFAAASSGYLFPHYFILLVPSTAILSGLFLASVPVSTQWRTVLSTWLLLVAVFTGAAPYAENRWLGEVLTGRRPDLPAKIAEDLKPVLRSGDRLYIYDYHPIIYHLLGIPPPTRFVMPFHHLKSENAGALGIDRTQELARIMAQAPQFVIVGSDPKQGKFGEASEWVAEHLQENYRLWGSYNRYGRRTVWVYERKAGPVAKPAQLE